MALNMHGVCTLLLLEDTMITVVGKEIKRYTTYRTISRDDSAHIISSIS